MDATSLDHPSQLKRTRNVNSAGGNQLLESLPDDDRERLLKSMDRFEVRRKSAIFDQWQPIEFVHFPVSAVASIVSRMENGDASEVATVGNEGFVGIPLALGALRDAHTAFYQIPGETLRMRAGAFT